MPGKLFNLLLFVALLNGCAQQQNVLFSEPLPAAKPVIIEAPAPATKGSLWTERKGGLFYDMKARHVGDILTVAIFERASASKQAETSTGRKNSASADISKFFGLEKKLGKLNGAIDPTNLIGTSYENDFKGSGKTSRKEDLVATLTTQVLELLPNGNLRIEGGKTVTVNRESQLIQLTGIVRPSDVSPGNVVDSMNILDARISYTGEGVISDKQGQGWLTRILDLAWPL